jgi:hypothetical protein
MSPGLPVTGQTRMWEGVTVRYVSRSASDETEFSMRGSEPYRQICQ